MKNKNKLPSRFQIGDEVMYRFCTLNPVKVISVEFTESKVSYCLENSEGYKYLWIDSLDVLPVEKQETDNWISVKERLPDNGVVVNTKIDDEEGTRNEQKLKRQNNLWFFSDGSMYVYYTPTHWQPVEKQESK